MSVLSGDGVRVLLVGTGSHRAGSRLPDVDSVPTTLDALEACFLGVAGVQRSNLRSLLNPKDPEAFLDEVISSAGGASELLLLYYVGHGALSPTGAFHLATEATVDLATKATYQALPWTEIDQVLRTCLARSVVVVLDCCFSHRARLRANRGALLVSADRDEHAIENGTYTVFSGELIRALREGIPTAPSRIGVRDLHDHLTRELGRRNRPRPLLDTVGLDGDLKLVTNVYRWPPRAPAEQSDRPCPYRGLAPFTEADEEEFCGRDDLTGQMLARLGGCARDGGVAVVSGPSGSGKTSLLLAGVLPAVRRRGLGIDGSSNWRQLTLTPGEDPLGALSARLAELGRTGDAGRVKAELAAHPEQAGVLVKRLAGSDGRVLIVLDQFEEVFASHVPDQDRRTLVRVLASASATTGGEPAALVVLGLRSDFHGHCARFPELVSALQNYQMVVRPMTTAELRSAVIEPARRVGLALEPGLVAMMLHDIGANPDDELSTDYDPGALPLLSHALLMTWHQQSKALLTVEGYQRSGGVKGAVRATAEATFDDLGETAQRNVKGLLLKMVHVGEGVPDTRRPLDMAGEDPTGLDAFVQARLVTRDGDTALITHEALIREWSRLRSWIAADRRGRLFEQEVEAAARTWHGSGKKDASLLLRGSRLEEAEDWLRTSDRRPEGSVHTFIDASTRQQRRAKYVRRALLAVLVVLLLLSIGFARYAFDQRDEAIVNQLVAGADEQDQVDPSLAAQLDIAAYRVRASPEARTRLIASQGLALSRPLPGQTAPVRALAFAPNGGTLTTVGADGSGQRRRMADLDHPPPPSPPSSIPADQIKAVAVSPDGQTLVAVGADGAAQVRNVSDPAVPAPVSVPLPVGATTVNSVAVGPDGHTLAVAGTDGATGTVRLWSLADPAHPVPLSRPIPFGHAPVNAVGFSPDGRTLVAGNNERTVQRWSLADPSNPRPDTPPVTDPTGAVNAVAVSPDGHVLAESSGPVRLWNLTDPSGPVPVGPPLVSGGGPVSALSFSPDGHALATTGGNGEVRLWNLPPNVLGEHTGPVKTVAFSPDGRTLVTAGADRTARLWSLADPTRPVPLGSPLATAGGPHNAAAFSPDSQVLAVADGDGVGLWGMADRAHPVRLTTLTLGDGPVNALAFSPNGDILAVGGATDASGAGGTARLWSLVDPAHPTRLGFSPALDSPVNTLAFSGTGTTLATASGDGSVRLWDLTDATQSARFGGPLPVNAIAFGPGVGTVLATARSDGTVQLWDLTNHTAAEPLGVPLPGGAGPVNAVAFSPDGRTLATVTAAGDHNLRLWNLADPNAPALLGPAITAHSQPVNAVAFSPDGHRLVTSSDDHTARLWELDDVNLVMRRICGAAGDSLTPEQWQRYAPQLTPEPLCNS